MRGTNEKTHKSFPCDLCFDISANEIKSLKHHFLATGSIFNTHQIIILSDKTIDYEKNDTALRRLKISTLYSVCKQLDFADTFEMNILQFVEFFLF